MSYHICSQCGAEDYTDPLAAAALIAERVRDAMSHLGRHDACEAAETIRMNIETLRRES